MTKWTSIQFRPPTAKGKRIRAVLRATNPSRIKTINFGALGGSAFPDHKNQKTKEAWIARHRVRENWEVPDTAGSLSRWILWDTTSILENKKRFAKRFGLKLIR